MLARLAAASISPARYDAHCAGAAAGCPVLQPAMRFWEQNNFAARNSGQALQDDARNRSFWMVNPALDFAQTTPTSLWVAFQANWATRGVMGCIAGQRNEFEVSFCDAVSSKAKYLVVSVRDPFVSLFDLNKITGAGGAKGNILPLTDVPVLTGLPMIGTTNAIDATQMDVSVTIAAGGTGDRDK